MNDYDFWFWLNVIANFAQLESYNILIKDANNNELLDYLKHQDRDLFNQIIEQNKIIIGLLKEGKDNA